MKKKFYTLLFALLAIVMQVQAQVVLNAENFPDANFRAALASELGINEGDEITAEKIASKTYLNFSDKSIADLTGIEYFTALKYLYCHNNQLTALDVSNNTALTQLLCNNNQLTALDVSNNTALTTLHCYNNQLTALDVSNNTALTELACYSNQLTALDVSNNTALTSLYCQQNQLTTLDVSNNTALTRLYCYNNQLTALDVSNNTALTTLYCYYNQLTALDISKNMALITLRCYNNQLTALDVSNNTALTTLHCYNNQLTTLDVSNNTALTTLYCYYNQLTVLDVSNNTALTTLSCHSNQLADLDISKNTALTMLSCGNNQLTTLDVSNNTALTTLYCHNNRIQGEKMDAFIQMLPMFNGGSIYLIHNDNSEEGNIINNSQITNIQEKGWAVYYYENNNWNKYNFHYTGPGIELNSTNFPDITFRSKLILATNVNEGEVIPQALLQNKTELNLKSYMDGAGRVAVIQDLTGIEHFTGLKKLDCSANLLSALNLSNNNNLNEVHCYFNKINNEQMASLISTLPSTTDGQLYVLHEGSYLFFSEENQISKKLVDAAKAKGWKVYCNKNNQWVETDGQPDINDLLGDYTFYYGSSGTTTMDCQLVKTSSGYGLKFTGTPEGIIPVNMSFDNTTMKFKNTQFVGDWKTASVTTEQAIVLLMYTNGTSVYRTASTTSVGLEGTLSIDPETADVVWTMTGTAPSGRDFYALRVANTSEGTYETITSTNISSWINPVKLVKKKKVILLNEENFPDANFRAALANILGISEGDEISQEKINATTQINVSDKSISDLKGIEHFTALTTLYCNYNQLTALNVSKNTALTNLYCDNNQLAALDVSKSTALTQLYCGKNKLTALDVSNNTALGYLSCGYNQLTTLDVSKNTALTYLFCFGNQLTTLDVSKNTALTRLDVSGNQLTALDVSKNTALKHLTCGENQLTTLDVSKNTALITLIVYENLLTALDVSKNTTLEDLLCTDNQLTALDISKNTALTQLNCSGNQLTALDVSKNTALTALNVSENQLTALDMSKNTALRNLRCNFNKLTALDVNKNTALYWLYCYGNQLTALDVSKNTALTMLFCNNNQIKGAQMDALITSLPTVNLGHFIVIDTKDANEGNVCTKTQVAAAKAKGWIAYDYNYNSWSESEYEGSDELILNEDNFTDGNFRATLSQILGISEDDEITPEMIDEITTLNVSNKIISNLKGIEHFTELETLYCQLNQIKDADMDALIAGLPTRNVNESSPRLVAPRKANNTWGSLYAYDNTTGNEGNVITTEQVADANAKGWKVYQYNGTAWEEYTGTSTGITNLSNDDDIIGTWYTLDGKRLNDKPQKAGIYIVKMNNGTMKKVAVK